MSFIIHTDCMKCGIEYTRDQEKDKVIHLCKGCYEKVLNFIKYNQRWHVEKGIANCNCVLTNGGK